MHTVSVPDKYLEFFTQKTFAHLATLMKDGSPQVTPVWVEYDGTHILVNSARDRQKDLNMRRDKRVALSLIDPDDPYRYLQVRGVIEEITEEGADDHIDRLAKKYLGVDTYPYRAPGEVRVMYKILPKSISG